MTLSDQILTDYDHRTDGAYITAEFYRLQPGLFTIGDNQTYGGYYNPPLEDGYSYFVYVGLVSRINETVSMNFRVSCDCM